MLGISRFWPPSTGILLRQPSCLLLTVLGIRCAASRLGVPFTDRSGGDRQGYAEIRPRKRAGPGALVNWCQLLACRRIYEGGGVLGLQSSSLLLCRNHSPPMRNERRSIANSVPPSMLSHGSRLVSRGYGSSTALGSAWPGGSPAPADEGRGTRREARNASLRPNASLTARSSLALGLALGDRRPLVVLLFATGQRQLELQFAAPLVQRSGTSV